MIIVYIRIIYLKFSKFQEINNVTRISYIIKYFFIEYNGNIKQQLDPKNMLSQLTS